MAKITDITEQVGDASRVSVFIDGKFAFGMSAAAATSLKLKIGAEVEPDKLESAAKADSAYAKALHYLSFRARSAKEIERYLAEKEFSPDTIETVLDRLALNRYINDEEFALSVAKAYALKEGKKGVRDRLIRAGISDSVIDGVLDYDEIDGAKKAAQKYLRTRDFDKEKLWRHLYSKGFSGDTIGRAVSMIQKENSEDDESDDG